MTSPKSVLKIVVKPPLPIDLYLIQEFQAMDTENRGLLDCRQLTNVLLYLGHYQSLEQIQRKMMTGTSRGGAFINQAEYVNLIKNDKQLLDGTKLLRDLFKKFDKDNSGYALKVDIVHDLKEMGIYSVEMGKKIDSMDFNKDGNISYKDFLKIYFQGK